MNKIWWVKVSFDDFCAHYFDKSDDEIVKDVRQSVKSLLEKDGSGASFGAKMVREASKRISEKSVIYRNNINVRWHPEKRKTNGAPTINDIYDFCHENDFCEGDARDFYEMTFVERGGKDRNGNQVTNWKGMMKRFCESRARKRNDNG